MQGHDCRCPGGMIAGDLGAKGMGSGRREQGWCRARLVRGSARLTHFAFCSSFFPLQPPERKKKGTQPCLGKPVRKLGFWPSFLALEHKLNPEILPPAGKSGSALLCPLATLVVGANCFDFLISLEFPPNSRRLLLPRQAQCCSWKFWLLIVLSV
ncbi:hypothetical protein SLEP1_g42469 [Rubroshorea leprosula]|uniref:Uncharacterized protein n=1 Tax=Rubroshorea leprosula TaxID=152421 RepID=A0AAV5LAU7_9ROSI|nr:hypothetical protein SLEP1_g42469 [Rubroshorea leprosula]